MTVTSREFHQRTMAHRLPLKNMTRAVGELYLDRYLPDITDEERAYLLDLCGQKLEPMFKVPEPQDPLFIAAMFMAGVSQGDLAALFGVRKQTIQSKIYRHTTKPERETMRETPGNIDLEAVAVAREMYYIMCKENMNISNKSATELGRLLLNAANAVMVEQRGDEPVAVRPRRYSNMNISSGKEEAARLIGQLDLPTAPAEQLPEAGPATSDNTEIHSTPAPVVRADEQSFLDSL